MQRPGWNPRTRALLSRASLIVLAVHVGVPGSASDLVSGFVSGSYSRIKLPTERGPERLQIEAVDVIERLMGQGHKQFAGRSGYSMRAFARDLGGAPAFVSLVLKGKKRLPPRLVNRAVKVLDMDMESAHELKGTYIPKGFSNESVERDPVVPVSDWEIQDKQKLKSLRHWFYVAIQ